MMSEIEVSKEVSKVVGIEEKGGLDASSYQDLPISDCHGSNHHNQANDLDKSYVFVIGTDGLPDDAVGNKDVVSESSSVSLEFKAATGADQPSELVSKNEDLNAVDGEVIKPLNEAKNGNVAPSHGDPPIVYDSTRRHESSSVGREGFQVFVADCLEERTDKTERLAEAEVKQVEDPHVNDGSLAEVAVDIVGDHDEKIVGLAKKEKFDDLVKSKFPPAPVENQESQVGALELTAESANNEVSNNITLHIHSSANANGGCEEQTTNDENDNQINISSTEKLQTSQGSQGGVVDVVECELPDVSLEPKDEVKLARDVVETAEHKVPPSTSLEVDVESHTISNKEEMLKEEGKTTLSLEAPENLELDTAFGGNIQGVVEQIGEVKSVVSSIDCHVETVCDLNLEGKNEELSATHVGSGIQYPEEPGKHPNGSEISHETMQDETKTEASMSTEIFPASNAHSSQTESKISDAEAIETVSSSPVGGTKSQIVENGLPCRDCSIRSAINEPSLGSDSTFDVVVLAEKEQTVQGGDTHAEDEVSNWKSEFVNSQPETFDAELEPGFHVHDISAISSGEKPDVVSGACGTEVLDRFNDDNEGVATTMLETEEVENMGDPLDGDSGGGHENVIMQENVATGKSDSNHKSEAKAEGSIHNMILREELGFKTEKKPFNFLVRIPRFDDDSLKEQIRLAKLHVDEKTKLRDAIQVQIQEKRASSQVHGVDYEFAKAEGRSARKLVRSTRMEIDSLHSVINKAKNALSVEDIDKQIYNMEHMIQHETLPLKEEKQLIREIKQLKQLREQLSSNMGSQDEIKQALEQREEVEERLKILRKELDFVKDRVLKAEAAAMEAEKKYDGENKKVKELQAQFRAADDVRQSAYTHLLSLRKDLSKKNKHFFKYRDDAAVANNYAFSGDTEALYCLCMDNVENFMELWNTNYEFRKDYMRFNERSTVRRLGTLDGRSLGPDERPYILPSYVEERSGSVILAPAKADVAPQIPIVELKQETTVESNDKSMRNMTEHKNQEVVNKDPAIPVLGNGYTTGSGRNITDEVHEEPVKSREEIELIRKAEEMRREEAEAKLKEQRRLEALAKANEARERKKRRAEKLQMRAELRTLKEAEEKEKEREKRLRKKERKKAASMDANDTNHDGETAPSSESAPEISKDSEVKDVPAVTPKKPKKPGFTKQSKSKSVPPPLRNRNKKKLQQWMWVGIMSLIILFLFWIGNISVFSNINLKRRSPVR